MSLNPKDQPPAPTPISVRIETPVPVPVVNVGATGGPQTVIEDQKAVLSPATTAEQNRASVGQRRINLIWETTQAVIAVSVTITTLAVSGTMAVKGDGGTAAFLLLSNVFFLVVGTYFQRTNHTKSSGTDKHR